MNPVEVHGANILLVNDLEANLAPLEETLIAAGYTHIRKTDDAEKAIELHREGNCDLLLLDLDYLGEDGFALMENLRKEMTCSDQCTIALTENPDLRVRSLRAGAKDVIDKLAYIDELLARIHNVLESYIRYQLLEKDLENLQQLFVERTTELLESEARFKGFTELASDWYWEQDAKGGFTKVSGPVPEILGFEVSSSAAPSNSLLSTGWNALEQSVLRGKIANRETFLDFEFTRNTLRRGDQTYLVSGQPMFDSTCHFIGYRGIGVEIIGVKNH